ncbi:MAG: porin family protein [Marinifilaceae bacterium]
MNKILITCLLVVSLLDVKAQKITVKTGFNLATFFAENNDDIVSSNFETNPGLSLEANIEFPINKTFAFETGMQFSMEGTQIHGKNEMVYGSLNTQVLSDIDMDLYYMNVPMNAKVYLKNSKVKVFGLFGAYWGVGIYGNNESKISILGDFEINNTKIKWGDDSDSDDLRRFDCGLNIGAGSEFNRFLFCVNYNYGLANISSYVKNGNAVNNRVLTFSIGYVIKE